MSNKQHKKHQQKEKDMQSTALVIWVLAGQYSVFLSDKFFQ